MLIAGKTWGIQNGRITWAALLSGFAGVAATLAVVVVIAVFTIKHERRMAREQRLRDTLARMVTVSASTDPHWSAYDALLQELEGTVQLLRMTLGETPPNTARAPLAGRWALRKVRDDRTLLEAGVRHMESAGLTRRTVEFTFPGVVNVLLQWGAAGFQPWETHDLDTRLADEESGARVIEA
jgi:hypothetical protein